MRPDFLLASYDKGGPLAERTSLSALSLPMCADPQYLASVVAAVPGVAWKGISQQNKLSGLGMVKSSLEVGGRHLAQELRPTRMHAGEQGDRSGYVAGAGVGQFRPARLVVSLDEGFILGKGPFEAYVTIGVTVG